MAMIFDDMKPRRVVGFNASNGNVIVEGNPAFEMQMYVGPQGTLTAKHLVAAPIDQVGEREKVPVEQRWAGAGIDQL